MSRKRGSPAMGNDLRQVMSCSPSELSREENRAIEEAGRNNKQYFFDSSGFRHRDDASSINISTIKKGFGTKAPSEMGGSQTRTKFTEWSAHRDASETFFYQTSKRSGVFEDNFRCTNYELALEFGRDPTGFIEPTSKPMKAIYIFPKDPPVYLNPESLDATPITRRDLPLVDPIGSFASKRRWD